MKVWRRSSCWRPFKSSNTRSTLVTWTSIRVISGYLLTTILILHLQWEDSLTRSCMNNFRDASTINRWSQLRWRCWIRRYSWSTRLERGIKRSSREWSNVSSIFISITWGHRFRPKDSFWGWGWGVQRYICRGSTWLRTCRGGERQTTWIRTLWRWGSMWRDRRLSIAFRRMTPWMWR